MKRLEILGMGCPKCNKLAELTVRAAKELGIEYEIVKITDINVIMGYRVMMTPALAVDGEVKVSGRMPSIEEIKEMLFDEPKESQ